MEGMDMGPEMAMPQMQTWTLVDLLLLFVMWTVMMVAMMVPSAAPMVLMFANVQRQRQKQQRPFVSTGVFLLGYLIIWTAFSLIATLAQWGLHSAALLSPMMISTSSLFGGVLLMAAGIFQWTPLKHTCLKHCRSPLGFITTDWRDGTWGALIMGLKHGSYCTGCCWALMALLFVAGVMNLFWVAIIAVFVLIEKIVPNGHWVSKASGLLLIAWGIWMIL
jgi:predicted metal-binding membrane protein